MSPHSNLKMAVKKVRNLPHFIVGNGTGYQKYMQKSTQLGKIWWHHEFSTAIKRWHHDMTNNNFPGSRVESHHFATLVENAESDPSWWLNQPIWKICSSNWIISTGRGENKQSLKPPPRISLYELRSLEELGYHHLSSKGWDAGGVTCYLWHINDWHIKISQMGSNKHQLVTCMTSQYDSIYTCLKSILLQ